MELTCKRVLLWLAVTLSLAEKQLRFAKSAIYFCVCEQQIRIQFCTYIIIAFCAKSSVKVNHKILATGKFHSNFITFKSLTFQLDHVSQIHSHVPYELVKIDLMLDCAKLWNASAWVLAAWLVFENQMFFVSVAAPLLHGPGPGDHTRNFSSVMRLQRASA